jgi:hypothetical protein
LYRTDYVVTLYDKTGKARWQVRYSEYTSVNSNVDPLRRDNKGVLMEYEYAGP